MRMELRERILNEALTMFMGYGIRSVTMDQISGHMGISKRTLYEIFRDKNEILEEGFKHFSAIHRNEARRIIKESDNVIEAIYILIRKGEELRQQINPMFFEDIRKYHPEIHKHLNTEGRKKEYEFTLGLLHKGVGEGLFRRGLDMNLVNIFIHQMMDIAERKELFPAEKYSDQQIFMNVMMPYLSGISTGKGQEQIRKYFEKEIK